MVCVCVWWYVLVFDTCLYVRIVYCVCLCLCVYVCVCVCRSVRLSVFLPVATVVLLVCYDMLCHEIYYVCIYECTHQPTSTCMHVFLRNSCMWPSIRIYNTIWENADMCVCVSVCHHCVITVSSVCVCVRACLPDCLPVSVTVCLCRDSTVAGCCRLLMPSCR